LQGLLGGDAADAEKMRKLHLRRHAIPHAQPARISSSTFQQANG
jgi:hypothetical protein